MGTTISAADANRKFSMMLRRVREGHSYVVTSHGRPVARIVPVDTADRVSATARATLLERLKAAPVLMIGRWKRDDLYEDER